ncbi:MAG: oligosaccharide flippase family protein [Pseudomonadota bacterium]
MRSSFGWSTARLLVGQIGALVVFIILTGQLSPAVFGVFALALIFVEFMNQEGRYSSIDTLVQMQRADGAATSTVFWSMTAFYALVALIFWLAAPFIARALNTPEFTWVLRALALSLIPVPIMFGPLARLNMEHDFQAIAVRSIMATAVGGVGGVAVAFGPAPEWALVVQRVLQLLTEAVFLLAKTRLFPTWQFDRDLFGTFAPQVARIFVAQSCIKSLYRLLDFILAVFFGPATVGIWRIAERLLQTAFQAFAAPLSSLWVILLSAAPDTKDARRIIFLNLTQVSSLILVPIFGGLALVAQDIVDLLLDPRYQTVGPIFSILSVFALSSPFFFFRNGALIALKKTNLLVGLAILDLILLTGLLFMLRPYGTVTTISSLGIVFLVSSVAYVSILTRILSVPLFEFVRRVYPAYFATFASMGAVYAASLLLLDQPVWQTLIIKVLVGIGIFVAYVFGLHRSWISQNIQLLMDRDSAGRPATS